MKYVSREPSGAFNLTGYEEYLDKERGRLVTLVEGDELLSINRFALTDPGSFHDSRLEHLSITTSNSASARIGDRILRAEVRLKGPYFDRYFELRYEDVVSCKVDVPWREEDLLVHEVRIENDLLAHELQFDRGQLVEIVCGRLRFREIFQTHVRPE